MSSLKEWAIWYCKRNLAVFPVYMDKNPCTKNGFYNAEVDPKKAAELFQKYSKAAGIAIATGKPSGGVFVIDLDHHPERGVDGIELAEEWQHEHGPFPETWTAVSGSGGRHLYFMGDGSEQCQKNEDAGVDVRGNGGYIVVPPSKHPSGGVYYWDIAPNEIKLARANDSVYQFMATYKKETAKGQHFHLPTEIRQGCRNSVLFSAGSSLQAAGWPDEVIEVALQKLNEVSCIPPVSDREIDTILSSIKKYEKGGGVDRWTKRAEFQRQEILQDLRDQLKSSKN